MTKSQGLGMGRCARKPKIDGKAAVTEAVHHQPSLGVHTRAKTLALKSLQETSPYTASSYLQLRSRRLEKHLPVPAFARSRAAARNRPNAEPNPNSNPSPAPGHSRSPNLVNQAAGRGESPVNSDSVGSVPTKSNCFKMTKATAVAVREASPEVDAAETEGASGENVLEFDAFRTARETTHCDLITDSETIGMPGSATWCTKFTASKRQAPNPSSIPTNLEMEELFAVPEQLQQRSFVLRYNFDVVKDQPLPGRYEWVKLDS
ncbi:hypothetical protein OPV22_017535 [Ensete ventricosum]|uniref:Cyclin-dependent kinase inhibitor domain-containing protein n=1 Tax=Ensete ventricosum TaxID=4639 RepID=A0AAV8PFB2_ENSVE|nr:hypothetical protein OPV22_017535 [Ensete ventricosum]